ncbi:MAG: low molecular weight phosphotyrosine protein phosphatase [Gammaproteobacteria bacterium]|nr:low molecular weight phosphotyrosine protein phosphatase [Gammaproteobacteria bacterium]
MKKVNVLFICMGNICRSPTAQGAFERLVDEAGLRATIGIDSAGTHDYHVGKPPDHRAQETALRRGVDLSGQRARQVENLDFERFDYILAMDHQNHAALLRDCPADHRHKVRLFLEFAAELGEDEVPDPYYGGQHGFDHVFDLVEAAGRGLLEEIRRRHL